MAFHISYVGCAPRGFALLAAAQEHAAHHCIAIRGDHAVNATLVDDTPRAFIPLIDLD
jgi:hypothetical protein